MIKANLRLVVKLARDYEGLGVPLLDLISEGNIGLMKAVDRFDPEKGAKLSTYAALWIKQGIRKALSNQSKTIRLPVGVVGKISRMQRAALRLQQEFGREASDEELALELGIATSRLSEMRSVSAKTTSLDAPVFDNELTLSEVVEDERAENPSNQFAEKAAAGTLHEL